jgi:hypothetical protein
MIRGYAEDQAAASGMRPMLVRLRPVASSDGWSGLILDPDLGSIREPVKERPHASLDRLSRARRQQSYGHGVTHADGLAVAAVEAPLPPHRYRDASCSSAAISVRTNGPLP